MDSEKHLIDQLKHKIRSQQQEITKLTKEIKSTKRAYRQLETAFYLTPGHVYWKDKNEVYQACNDQQAITLGYQSGKDIVGKTDYDLPWGDRGDFLRQVDTGVMESQVEHVVEEPLPIGGGKEALFLSRKVPMYDETGQVSGIIGISFDISKEKQAEELKRKNIIAEQVIQRLKAISAGLSYEVRSSMTAVRLGFERTRQFFSKLAPLVKQLHTRSESQQHSDVTIEELTDYQQLLTKMVQRIDSSVALMDMQLKNMVTDRIEKHLFHHHQIKDSVQQAVDTFPLDDPSLLNKIHIDIKHCFKILGDKLLTKHVLWNLLNNALYFMKEEGHGEIFITTEEMVEYHLLRFKDTAKGIRVSKVTQIFEPFYTSRKEGHGLGLHFCQLVMQSYGGKIECWAKEGEYAEFLLSFPKINKLEIL